MATSNYFPNQPVENLELEMKLREVARSVPEQAQLQMYEALSSARPTFRPAQLSVLGDNVVAVQDGRRIFFPRPIPLVQLSHLVCGLETLLKHKYCLPGFVEVEPGDVVIDCGAYVGAFSFSAAKVAREVHAFEPDEANFECVKRNFAGQSNAVLNNVGLYSESRKMTLNISASSVEHSLLTPDDGPPVATREIEVRALRDYCAERGIDRIDFCKIEAEGVELEVWDGLGDLRPKKIAIDVSPERNGESPAGEFVERLRPLGYELQQRGNVLFARLDDSPEERAARRVPKVIYSLWLQGRENAPPIVQLNFDRWERLNPGYELKILDAKDVQSLLAGDHLATSGITHQGLSDIVRAKLLLTVGGVWTDAAVLPLIPLDDWLPAATSATGFFAFERYESPLSSWFLASSPGNLVMQRWWAQVNRVWSVPRKCQTDPVFPEDFGRAVSPEVLDQPGELTYFWFHGLFQYLLENDAEVMDIWLRRTRLSAGPAHELQALFARTPATATQGPTDSEILTAAYGAPVQKLNWRLPYPVERLRQLLDESREPAKSHLAALPPIGRVPLIAPGTSPAASTASREQLLVMLEQTRAEAASHADLVQSMRRSLSWRITTPLRAIKSIFRPSSP